MGQGRFQETLRAHVMRRPRVFLIAVVLLAWLPGFFTLPPLDRDESRFAQASKQMLETGDFVAIRLGREERDQKPIGIYWLQAASTALFGNLLPAENARTEIWTYRVPSLLGGLATVLVVFQLVRGFASVEAAFFSALLLGSTIFLMSETKIAKTDAVLLATITAVQYVLLRAYLAARGEAGAPPFPSKRLLLCGWAAFAVGILIKGPVIFLVCGATLLGLCAWDRRARWLARLRPLSGIALTLVIVLPWAIAIGIATQGGFYQKSLGQDFAMKLAGGQESHGAPPGYYTLLAPITFWPAFLFLLPGLVFAIRRYRDPAIRFLLVWAAATWLMFEIAPTKLPHYVLPAYPALAIFAGLWLTQTTSQTQSVWERRSFVAALILFGLVGVALAGALLWAPSHYGAQLATGVYALPVLGGLLVVLAAVLALKDYRVQALAGALGAALCLYTFVGVAAPHLDQLWLSTRMAQAVERARQTDDPPLMLAGYSEPSALFLMGTQTELAMGNAVGEALARAGGLAFVELSQADAFLAALRGRAEARPLDSVEGLDYSNGQHMRLQLYRVIPSNGPP